MRDSSVHSLGLQVSSARRAKRQALDALERIPSPNELCAELEEENRILNQQLKQAQEKIEYYYNLSRNQSLMTDSALRQFDKFVALFLDSVV